MVLPFSFVGGFMNIEEIKKELTKDLDGVDLKTLQDVKNKYR